MADDPDARLRDRLEHLLEQIHHELHPALEDNHHRLRDLERDVSLREGTPFSLHERMNTHDHARSLLDAADRAARMLTVTDAIVVAGEQVVEASVSEPPEWFADLAELFPGLDPATVADLAHDDAARQGALMLYRGFRGEQLVAGLLASEALPVPDDVSGFRMAETTNQEGWDLILERGGTDVPANVKISGGADALRSHFADHPDVPLVFASTEAADALAGDTAYNVLRPDDIWPDDIDGFVVVDIGRSASEIGTEVTDALADIGSDTLADQIVEAIPLFALGLVTARAGWRLAASDTDADDIRARAWREAKDVLTNASAGEAAGFLLGDMAAAPVTLLTATARVMIRGVRADIAAATRRVGLAGRYLSRTSDQLKGAVQ